MRVGDLMKISWKKICKDLRRSLLIVAVMAVSFGVIFAINIWLRGVEIGYRVEAEKASGGKVVLLATNSESGTVSLSVQPRATMEEMRTDIEEQGGKIIGEVERLGVAAAPVVPEDLAKDALAVSLGSVPEDAMPVLVSRTLGEMLLGRGFSGQGVSGYAEYRESLIGKSFVDEYGAKYYVVGLAMDNFYVSNLSFKQLERNNSNLLNPILEHIQTPVGIAIIVDNGKRESWQTGVDVLVGEDLGESLVASFDNIEDAYRYLRNGKGKFRNVTFSDSRYNVDVLLGMAPDVSYIFGVMRLVAGVVAAVLSVLSAIVVIFTAIRLVDGDKPDIALYYSLGATRKQVAALYLGYFIGLILLALLLAFGLASGAVLMFSLANQGLLGIQAMLGFSLAVPPEVRWYGVDMMTLVIALVMLALAPICVFVNKRRIVGPCGEKM